MHHARISKTSLSNPYRRLIESTAACRLALAPVLAGIAISAPAAPTISFGTVETLCASDCDPIGGVGLAGDQLGFMIIDSSSGSDVPTFVVVDKATGDQVSSTALGGGSGYQISDVTADGAGGAWIVGTLADNGDSIPGRWHTSDLTTVETPLSFDGLTDLSFNAVAMDGTAFGVTSDTFATKVSAAGVAVNLAAGLVAELPTSAADSDGDGGVAVGDARDGAILTLAAWDGNTLGFQDDVTGGNGVVGERQDGATVLMGLRIPVTGPQIGVFVDPFGTPAFTSLGAVVLAELAGMDDYGFGYGFGSLENDAVFFDTNTMETISLSAEGIGSFRSLVSMDYLGASEWLFVMEGSTHYVLVLLDAPSNDTDEDGVGDDVDNCTDIPNADQRDSNGDGFGNICDADINNDCIVNVIDLGLLRTVFFTDDADADFNGNGVVNAADLGIMRLNFFMEPGPGVPVVPCD